MRTVLITGSTGLTGSEAASFYCERGFTVIGIDNDMRQTFFGKAASTEWNRIRLERSHGTRYIHYCIDIRDNKAIAQIFRTYGKDIGLVIHAAAQPSHDWAAKDPFTDFTVNANGTLILLENTRQYCPEAVFIFCSTNKVYGDNPNLLPLCEQPTRWEIDASHPYFFGINESLSIDQCKHSLFGSSKVAADVLVQEYGRYFGMQTATFRCGCITGPGHSAAELHGFLSYLIKCTITGTHYTVFGYKGKQVRDNIHSLDLANAFFYFHQNPRIGEVYNLGGSRFSNCSILEAIQLCEAITGKRLDWSYDDTHRNGDHIWWISSIEKFKNHYPEWNLTYTVPDILEEIYAQNISRWILD